MKMIPQISLLLSLSLLPLLSYCFINPDGQWTYMEGSGYGPMYLCLGANNGSILTGSYSEFGYVRGTFKRSTRTVTGKWFEIGLTDSEGLAASGYFTWVFDKEFTYFTGSYYHDGQDPSEAQDWSETHIDFMKPTNLQCFRYANSDDSLNGKWVWDSTRMYLSQNGVGTLSSYYNSSLVNPDSPGYSEGTCDSYYQVCHGQIQRPDYYGQIMFVLGRHKLLYITAFEGSWDDDSLNIPDQLNGNHLLTNATLRASYNLTEEEAAQYQVILFQGSFMGTPSDLSSDYIPFVTNVGTDNAISGYYFESSVLRGTYDWMSRTLSGLWFDPGLEYPMNTYTTGTFEFAMSEDWGSIVGSFSDYRIGETEPYATAPWGPFFRASFALPSNSAAMYDASSPSTPISGTFTGDWSLYLCASDNSFKASFIIEKTGQVGYAVGRCGPLYKVCNGDFISSSQRGELLITVLTDTTIQIDYYYATFLNIPEPSLRNSVTLTLQTSDVTSEECATNLYLPFVGNFTDPVYGYTYYISYDPIARLLNGFYSELGVTRGAINRDTEKWEARWVEPGLYYENSSNPTSGYVYFELVTLDSFDGTFFFDDDLFRALQWGTVNRISYVTPTNAQAWVDTAYNTPLNGTWFTANNDKIWFCEYYEGSPDPNLDHPYAMAFSWNVTADEPLTHGRSEGVCSYQTRVCHGTWESEDGDSGVLILSLADQNNLRLSSFTGEMSSQVTSQIGNATLHRVTTYSRLITYATDEECHQYDGAASVGVGFVGLFVCVLASLLW